MLTRDEAQVRQRIEKEGYLPLDGMLTQRATSGRGSSIIRRLSHDPHPSQRHRTLAVLGSPAHMEPVIVKADPGKAWIGPRWGACWTRSTTGSGICRPRLWRKIGRCTNKLEWACDRGRHDREDRRVRGPGASLALTYQADTRYARRFGTQEQILFDLLAYLKTIPVHGRTPSQR